MKDIVIVGHGGLAKEVSFLIEEINRTQSAWNLRGYISADRNKIGTCSGKYAVVETDDWLMQTRESIAVVVAIGRPETLRTIHTRLKQNKNLEFPNLIHPRAFGDWDQIKRGDGNIVMGGASFTTQITLGSLNIFNPGCTIAHDCVLGSYNLINPSASLSGEVVLGDEIMVGTGARILQQLQVCSRSVVGAAAVVTRSIEEPGTYVGIPARKMEKQS